VTYKTISKFYELMRTTEVRMSINGSFAFAILTARKASTGISS